METIGRNADGALSRRIETEEGGAVDGAAFLCGYCYRRGDGGAYVLSRERVISLLVVCV